MISGALARLCYPPRREFPAASESTEDITAFIASRTLPYPSKLEDEFARRALGLGIASGMVLDVGTRVGLTALKLLWQNENLVAIGIDRSPPMIEHARATAEAWDLSERAVFQVGDPLRMRFKSAYFDLVISDCTLHRFADAPAVFDEIRRVLKPKGALLIRDFRRPNRFRMATHMKDLVSRFGDGMRLQVETSLASSYTTTELMQIVDVEFPGIPVDETDPHFLTIEQKGETDPNSWIVAREQYR